MRVAVWLCYWLAELLFLLAFGMAPAL